MLRLETSQVLSNRNKEHVARENLSEVKLWTKRRADLGTIYIHHWIL